MWWLLVPVAAYTIYELFSNDEDNKELSLDNSDSNSSNNRYKLIQNFNKIKNQSTEAQNRILFIGQPGAGKSSLILTLTKSECNPRPVVGIQTDATNWSDSILDDFYISYKGYNIVDTPGYNTEKHPTNTYLDFFPFDIFNKIVFIVGTKISHADKQIFDKLRRLDNVFLVRSFTDTIFDKNNLSIIENDMRQQFQTLKKIHFVSSDTKEGIDELYKLLFE